jgi:hypothetical protein
MLEFHSALHEYRDGDVVVPSVTRVLKTAGIVNERFFTSDEARDRGAAVHELCERYAQGRRVDAGGRRLDSLEYVNAFALWLHKTGAYAVSTETTVDHVIDGFRYCGRYDLLAEIRGRRVLVDIKTGSAAKWHFIQLMAYALAVKPDMAMALYLKASGEFVERYPGSAEMLDALSAWKTALVRCREEQKSLATSAVLNKSWFQ